MPAFRPCPTPSVITRITPAQMARACGLEGSRAYESVSAWERGEARGDVGRSDAAPVQGVAARREGRAARGKRQEGRAA